MNKFRKNFVAPAKAGVQSLPLARTAGQPFIPPPWVPAFAGMTVKYLIFDNCFLVCL